MENSSKIRDRLTNSNSRCVAVTRCAAKATGWGVGVALARVLGASVAVPIMGGRAVLNVWRQSPPTRDIWLHFSTGEVHILCQLKGQEASG